MMNRGRRQRGGGRREGFGVVDADNSPRLRSDDAVDSEPVARLQTANGRLGPGSEFAVDFEPERVLQALDGTRRFGLRSGRFP